MPLLLTPTTGPPDLDARLINLRRRWRRAVVFRGICALAAMTLGAAVVVGGLDFALNLSALIRAVLLVGLLAGGAIFLRRGVLQPWRELGDDLALALRVEARFPDLNDALASSVQFLSHSHDNSALGSPALRQATRRRAVRAAEDCDFDDLLDPRPRRRAAAALAAALLAAAPLVWFAPASSRMAVVRFLDPFGDHPWPPQTALTFDAPEWLARGEPFVLHGRLAGVIPERVSFAFALDRGSATEQAAAVTPEERSGSFVVRLEPNRVPKDFRYRVRANDSESSWRSVRVLTPPQLASLDGRPSPQVHLDFPLYTDLLPRDLPDGGGSVECVTGTVVRLRAATDRPIAQAWIEPASDPPRTTLAAGLLALAAITPTEAIGALAAGRAVFGRIPATLDASGERLELAFRPYVGGPYYLRFEDAAGISGRRPLTVILHPDPSPAVTLERPSAGQDSLDVLPDATVSLAAHVEDPIFAVRTVALEFRCGRDEPVQRVPIYEPRVFGAALPQLLAAAPAPPLRLRPPLVQAERRLDLKQFRHADGRPLREGDTLTLQVTADDFDDVTAGKPPGRSHEVELHIVGPAALQTALQKSRADIERELREMLKLQGDALERSTATETQRRSTGTLGPGDLDRLLQAEQLQQQLRDRLGNEREGLRATVDRLRRALRDNPLPRSPERDRLDALAAELERLDHEELEPIEPLLAQARQERGPVAPEARKNGALPKAIGHQQESERTLRDLLDGLKPWTDARELRADAGSLLQEQDRAARERAELQAGQGQPGLSRDRLTPEQRQQLDRLRERQSGLADRADELKDKLNQRLQAATKAQEEKEAEARDKDAQAAERERQAADPSIADTPQAAGPRQQAQDLRRQAEEAREAAAAMRQEADALAKARQALETTPSSPGADKSDAQPPTDSTLAGQQRKAAEQIGQNQLGNAQSSQESAAAMLNAMRDALDERATPDADRLAKRLKTAERELEDLIQDQERLQKRAQEAGQVADPTERRQELEHLAREQERLQQRARDLAQRLTRQHGEQAGRDLRGAARAMDQARDQLDQGDPPVDKQDDALDRLDDAQRELSQARQEAEDELQREQRAKLTDALKGLKARQESLVAEAERLFQEAKGKGWSRPRQASLNHLADAEADLGVKEVGPLAERQFQNDKVIAHIIRQAADAMAEVRPAVDRVADDGWQLPSWESDRATVQAPQQLALRRLTQLLDVLKDDEKDSRAQGEQKGGTGQPGQGGAGGAVGESVPPLAQLKLLRTLQAELNEQTAAFAKAHPDLTKLTPEEQAQLTALRRTQAELATLLDETAPEPPPTAPGRDKSGDKK